MKLGVEWYLSLQDHMSTTYTAEVDPKYLTINPFSRPESDAAKAAMINGLTAAFAFLPVKDFVEDVDSLVEAVKNHSLENPSKGAAKTVELQKEWFSNNTIPHMECVTPSTHPDPRLNCESTEWRNVRSSIQ